LKKGSCNFEKGDIEPLLLAVSSLKSEKRLAELPVPSCSGKGSTFKGEERGKNLRERKALSLMGNWNTLLRQSGRELGGRRPTQKRDSHSAIEEVRALTSEKKAGDVLFY